MFFPFLFFSPEWRSRPKKCYILQPILFTNAISLFNHCGKICRLTIRVVCSIDINPHVDYIGIKEHTVIQPAKQIIRVCELDGLLLKLGHKPLKILFILICIYSFFLFFPGFTAFFASFWNLQSFRDIELFLVE